MKFAGIKRVNVTESERRGAEDSKENEAFWRTFNIFLSVP